ncbi:MAG: hypothetical protein COZ70_10305 [Deltaproteobacteria bacterium CG_4_8_14_3_um_filter_51_11]|nr:hypothetical protein [bacterium]NCP10305.1 hypothetical protein [bacterium]PIX19178.1 MAG: hypothetical protein COZ70_10305 [Deltaproteobacteria bacterium CG_4_8_14_3_um_filter_51_11]
MKKAMILAVMVVVMLCVCPLAMGWNLGGTLQEWVTTPLRPMDIAVTSSGVPYLTYYDTGAADWPVGKIFSINPADGSTTVFDAPAAWGGAGFKMIDNGPDGIFWVSDTEERIVRFDPTALNPFSAYSLPGAAFNFPADPTGIRVAPDGMVWFTCESDPSLGRFNPATSAWDRFPALMSEVLPDPPVDIAFAQDGMVWFTIRRGVGNSPRIGRLNPATGVINLWTYAGAMSPYGIQVVGTTVWFLDHQYVHLPDTGALVRFDTVTEAFTIYETPADLRDAHWLVVDPDGIIWFTSFADSAIGTFNPATEVFESRPLSGRAPMGIALLPQGQVWWAETYEPGMGGAGRITIEKGSHAVPALSPVGLMALICASGVAGAFFLYRRKGRVS